MKQIKWDIPDNEEEVELYRKAFYEQAKKEGFGHWTMHKDTPTNAVVREWRDYTRECITELVELSSRVDAQRPSSGLNEVRSEINWSALLGDP